MRSISFYLIMLVLKSKGIKRKFSESPIDYLFFRKDDVKSLYNCPKQDAIYTVIKIEETVLTKVAPKKLTYPESVILYCPGGAFIYGPTQMNWDAIKSISNRIGINSYLIDYPKAPEHKIDEINKNIDQVYAYLTTKYSSKKIILIGDSVGGTLMITLVQRLLERNNGLLPKSIILISPVVDSSMTNSEIYDIENKDRMLSLKGVLSAKKMCAGDLNLKDKCISPLYGNFSNFIPTTIFIAEDDIMRPDQIDFIQKLKSNNLPVNVVFGKGMPHIWPLLPLMRESKKAMKRLTNFVIDDLKNQAY